MAQIILKRWAFFCADQEPGVLRCSERVVARTPFLASRRFSVVDVVERSAVSVGETVSACGLPDSSSCTLCVSHADSKADIVHSSLLVSISTGLHQQPNSPLPSGPCGSSWGCLGTVAHRIRGLRVLRGVYLHLGFGDGCTISVSRGATVEPTPGPPGSVLRRFRKLEKVQMDGRW